MAAGEIGVLDYVGTKQQLSTTTDANGNLVGSTCITDPSSGNKANVNQGVLISSSDGLKATYRYFSAGNTPAATPTDVFTLTGSLTKTVRIKSIILSGLATTAGQFVWTLVRRSSGNGSGTSTTPTAFPSDVNDPNATAVMTLYTANPATLGTAVGNVRGGRLFHNVSTAQNDRLVWDFTVNTDKALILRGSSDIVAINGAGATLPAGASLDIEIEWEEDLS